MRISRIVAAGDGGSRFDDLEVDLPAAGPSLFAATPWPVHDITFLQTSQAGNDGLAAWHTAPDPRLIVCLSGRSRQETSDGDAREFGAGEMFLTCDTTGIGHRTVNFGDDVSFLIARLAGPLT
jgi:hypothetical protein